MAGYGLIEEYLQQLTRYLGRGNHNDVLLHEVADHLQQSADSLMANGVESGVAERLAVERFGEPSAVAKSLLREQTGAASTFTRLAGMSAVGGGLLLVVAFAPMTYLVMMGGPRPRSEMLATLLIGLGQFALVALLAAIAVRSTAHRRRRVLLATLVPLGLLSVFNLGYFVMADLFNSRWIVAALQLLYVAAQAVLLVPWSTRRRTGTVWAHWVLLVSAVLNVAYWSLLALYYDGTSGDQIFILSNVLRWLSLPLLAMGMVALGRRLWVERVAAKPVAA